MIHRFTVKLAGIARSYRFVDHIKEELTNESMNEIRKIDRIYLEFPFSSLWVLSIAEERRIGKYQ